MKKLLILSVLFVQSAFGQMANSTNTNLSVGNKAVELGFTHTTETEIIFGGSFALTDSKVIEDRANQVDRYTYLHKLNTKYTPTVFGLIGGNFDRINFIGKVGVSYINQDLRKVNNTQNFSKDNKTLYVAIGMEAMYQISDDFGVSLSFDNVNAAMLGINYKLN